MNKEVKIRGWDLEEHKWVYGVLNPKILKFEFQGYEGIYTGYGREGLIDENSVGIFTNEKDVNKEEIYEGDIVESTRGLNHIIGVVVFYKGCWYISVKGENYYRLIPRFSKAKNKKLGNIYQNKDLLKGE